MIMRVNIGIFHFHYILTIDPFNGIFIMCMAKWQSLSLDPLKAKSILPNQYKIHMPLIKSTFQKEFIKNLEIVYFSIKLKEMFPPRIELRTFSVLGRRDNHYTMETYGIS